MFRKTVPLILLVLAGCQPADPIIHDGPMVLAASWQPAFCETATRRPECLSQHEGRYDADHFSLHGLWPQPGSRVYCDVSQREKDIDKSGRWKKLPALPLSEAVISGLKKVMPGSRSALHRHEWVKHGTCYSRDPETYYRDSLALIKALNVSPIRDLFANNLGRNLSVKRIRKAFDSAIGKGAGGRVALGCRRDGDRQIIYELTISLKGTISDNPDLAMLMANAPRARKGCPGGIVDPVGYQ